MQHAWAPEPFRILLYLMVLLVGMLVGLEIPLVMRLLRGHYRLKDLVSQVLTYDYLGALAVSLAFPLFFVPLLGMVRTGLFFGLANVLIAVWALWVFRDVLPKLAVHASVIVGSAAALCVGFFYADRIMGFTEANLYNDRVIYAESSPYQRIVLTQARGDLRLHLNNNLQFSSRDEYRYHESLVLPALAAHPAPNNALILGGGDGMVARELLRDARVKTITLVDQDNRVTDLFQKNRLLTDLNENALNDDRVEVINTDALAFISGSRDYFDLIIVDLPDPTNFSLAKLYSRSFYMQLASRLTASGFTVIQTTSPLFAPRSFWSVVTTVEAAGLRATPYHATVPSFGVWGFIIASHRPFPKQAAQQRLISWPNAAQYNAKPRFITPAVMTAQFEFPADMQRREVEVNRLQDPVLTRYYREEWGE